MFWWCSVLNRCGLSLVGFRVAVEAVLPPVLCTLLTGNVNHDCHSRGRNIHNVRLRRIDVAAAGVALVIDVPCS
ncbi:hypothetical protein Y032_0052g2225 [Ancylostoma ceylanicum]|uniref:Secreted protein n=1 Tax=Ancylostoma ceylanicum TaxID=53326 RepID=A0A016U731_9BILA|nr:hypothetical protein Y032_0052g2225 [Ancylostoma ceylanicum]